MITAACHVHSEWSYDAKWTLKELATAFGKRGYRVVMTTEHDRGFTEERRLAHRRACEDASSESLLMLPGIEYSDAENRIHVLVWGPVPFLGEGLPTGELLREVAAANGVAVLAHPSRKDAWKYFDPAWQRSLLGIEIWNRKTDGWSPSRTAPALLEKSSLVRFASLDFHDSRQFFPLGMSLDVSPLVTEEAILGCLRAGRCHPTLFGSAIGKGLTFPLAPALRFSEFFRRRLATIRRRYLKRPGPNSKK